MRRNKEIHHPAHRTQHFRAISEDILFMAAGGGAEGAMRFEATGADGWITISLSSSLTQGELRPGQKHQEHSKS